MRISEKKTILNYVLNALLALSVIPKHTYFSSTCPNLNFIVKTFFNTLQSFVKWRGGSLFWYLYPTPISLCLLALEVCATVLGHSFGCEFSYRLFLLIVSFFLQIGSQLKPLSSSFISRRWKRWFFFNFASQIKLTNLSIIVLSRL